MIARLQKNITCCLLAFTIAWALYWRNTHPVLSVIGVLVLLSGHSVFLGFEMLAMRRVNRSDPSPDATDRQVLRAWLRETLLAPTVFCWRQPFFPDAEPDYLPDEATGEQGVVLIHGLVCNRGFWTPWLQILRDRRQPFIAVNLEPISGDIEIYRPIVEAAVARMTDATGRPPVLLCHSMGGLVARDWLRSAPNHDRVARVITLASPHRGTWLARWARHDSGRQMQLDGPWLAALAATEKPTLLTRFSCWYSNCDNVVFPAMTATLPWADNRLAPGLPHIGLAFDPQVMEAVLADLQNHRE